MPTIPLVAIKRVPAAVHMLMTTHRHSTWTSQVLSSPGLFLADARGLGQNLACTGDSLGPLGGSTELRSDQLSARWLIVTGQRLGLAQPFGSTTGS